jgi:hypothetical protein
MSRERTEYRWLLLILVFTVAACGPSQEIQQQLAELTAVSAEKDSLLLQVTENARLMSDISAEVARVKVPRAAEIGAREAPLAVTREALLADIRDLTTRVTESEERLAKSQERVDALSRDNTRVASSLKDFQKAALDFQATIANQKETIVALTDQVNSLREQNTRLVAENITLAEEKVALVDTVDAITMRDNTVYYVIGTKEELIERGIIEEEGGSRVLFVFGKRGKTVVPARELEAGQFTPIDKREVLEIPMPWADRAYRIASRQDLASLAEQPDNEGRIRGVLRIADPERFWAGSRFLILVQN